MAGVQLERTLIFRQGARQIPVVSLLDLGQNNTGRCVRLIKFQRLQGGYARRRMSLRRGRKPKIPK
jgi:hypothetical protein